MRTFRSMISLFLESSSFFAGSCCSCASEEAELVFGGSDEGFVAGSAAAE